MFMTMGHYNRVIADCMYTIDELFFRKWDLGLERTKKEQEQYDRAVRLKELVNKKRFNCLSEAELDEIDNEWKEMIKNNKELGL